MFDNPFTPVFGGRPQFFFGREDVLRRFDRAMVDKGSEDRALFITGTRGNGKTALLEQFSIRAAAKGMKVVDLGSENTIDVLVRSLADSYEETMTIQPEASVSIFGTGGSISAGSISKTTRYTTADLQIVFRNACEKLPDGLLVTIDEVQKVSEPDLTAICDSFQMASRKGYNVMLAVAGLPFAHSRIIRYRGCTYLRRAAHEEIGLFSHEEADGAFVDAFSSINGLDIEDDALADLVAASFGQPYLMQLLGYHLVAHCNDRGYSTGYSVNREDVRRGVPDAYEYYEQRALSPMFEELAASERRYLVAMSNAMGDRPMVKSADVAKAMDREPSSVGRSREKLLENGIIAVPEYGSLMFTIPLLRGFLRKERRTDRNVVRALEWGV